MRSQENREASGRSILAEADNSARRARKREDEADRRRGYALPRCPVCGAQRKHRLLARICASCGAVSAC